MTERTGLIARLEAAPTGSRELDGEIALSLGWKKWGKGWAHWVSPQGWPNQHVPFFTESVDDALTLMPEGRLWSIGSRVKVGGYVAILNNDGRSHTGATPALALCIAAMRAMQP